MEKKKKNYSLIQDAKGLTLEMTFRHSYCVSGTVDPFTDSNNL